MTTHHGQTPALVAVDWGTTNRRVYALDAAGAVLGRETDGLGVTSVPADGFEAEVASIRARWPGAPLLLAGMVGSDRGWTQVPYVACPAGLSEIIAGLHWIEPGQVAIVPGLAFSADTRADVMRGEETQYFGAVAMGALAPDGLACHPGTHVKWAELADGRIARFRTVMSGELFALIRKHSILSAMIQSDAVGSGPVFAAGVAHGLGTGDIAAELFQVRARVLLGKLPAADAGDYVSGLLIGDDLRIGLGRLRADVVPVIGAPNLTALYAVALAVAGRQAVEVDGEAAFIAGIRAIAKEAGL